MSYYVIVERNEVRYSAKIHYGEGVPRLFLQHMRADLDPQLFDMLEEALPTLAWAVRRAREDLAALSIIEERAVSATIYARDDAGEEFDTVVLCFKGLYDLSAQAELVGSCQFLIPELLQPRVG